MRHIFAVWMRLLMARSDGLHFNADGNRIVFDAVMRTVEQHYPELMPRALREPIPHWRSFVGLPESDP